MNWEYFDVSMAPRVGRLDELRNEATRERELRAFRSAFLSRLNRDSVGGKEMDMAKDIIDVKGTESGTKPDAPAGAPRSRGRRIPIVATLLLVAGLAGGAAIAATERGVEVVERTHLQAVVDYHDSRYQTMSHRGSAEDAHWKRVVDFYDNR